MATTGLMATAGSHAGGVWLKLEIWAKGGRGTLEFLDPYEGGVIKLPSWELTYPHFCQMGYVNSLEGTYLGGSNLMQIYGGF